MSAYVDGELSPTEYDRVLAALRESALARDYVQSLRTMQARLKTLPKVTCPPQVTADIFKQQNNRLRSVRYQRLAWGIGLAASLLIGLGVTWQYLGNQQVQNTI
ncbi:MAG TPA: zf-HC2 domain-containing protein, partial [Gemmatales bacterium]|nr:zf-HC2 domain-containing protein [Gemmatales bacterium]